MTHILVRHKVNDYPAWKKVFDDFVDFRKSSGEQAYQILQKDGDTNNLYLLFQWDNEDNARTFFQTSELKDAMQRAGVAEAPDIQFLSQADQGTL